MIIVKVAYFGLQFFLFRCVYVCLYHYNHMSVCMYVSLYLVEMALKRNSKIPQLIKSMSPEKKESKANKKKTKARKKKNEECKLWNHNGTLSVKVFSDNIILFFEYRARTLYNREPSSLFSFVLVSLSHSHSLFIIFLLLLLLFPLHPFISYNPQFVAHRHSLKLVIPKRGHKLDQFDLECYFFFAK